MLLAIIIVAGSPASQYLLLDYRVHHGALPLGWVAVVLHECWPMFLVVTSLLLWLFPDGRCRRGGGTGRHGRRGRLAAHRPGHLEPGRAGRGRRRYPHPGQRQPGQPGAGAFRVLDVLVIAGTLVSWTAWLAIQVPTYRHASGEHRQQLKWLYSGAAIFVGALIIGVFIA